MEPEGPDSGREGAEMIAMAIGLACLAPLIGLCPDMLGNLGFEHLIQHRLYQAL
jgi:hypothetical protein